MKEILISRVFCGDYLDNELGHEVINFIRTDDGDHCLYIVPRGYIPGNHDEIESVIFVTPYDTGKVQVLAKAIGLRQISTSENSIKANTHIKNSVEMIAAKETFNGHSLFDIFGNSENCSLISFTATEMRKPIKPIFISSSHHGDNSFAISKNVGSQSQRLFLYEGSNDYNVINELVETESLWEPQDNFCPVSLDSLETFYEDLQIKAEKPRIVYCQMLNLFFDKICASSKEYDMLHPRVGDCFFVKTKGNAVFVGLYQVRNEQRAKFIGSKGSDFTLLFPRAFLNGNVKKIDPPINPNPTKHENEERTNTIDSLMQMSKKEIKNRFIEYLQGKGTPDNTCRSLGSAAFKIWNDHGPETFWKLIMIDNDDRFEYEVKEELIWNGIRNSPQYLSAIRQFREFCRNNGLSISPLDSDMVSEKTSPEQIKLKECDLDDLTERFRDYLRSIGYSYNSINTTASTAFFIWREKGKNAFWNLICKEEYEFEQCSEAIMLEFYPETSSQFSSYRSNLKRFREFYMQYHI